MYQRKQKAKRKYFKYFELKKNEDTIHTNVWNIAKTVLREIHSTNAYIRKEDSSQINDLS